MSDLTQDITDGAKRPAESQVDQTRVREHSLPDQIAADRYLKANQAAKRTGFPVRRTRAKPPGSV